jgi:hypothetical protein
LPLTVVVVGPSLDLAASVEQIPEPLVFRHSSQKRPLEALHQRVLDRLSNSISIVDSSNVTDGGETSR